MAHGGRRKGAGRPRGRRNKLTQATIDAVEAGGITPRDFLLSVMRDETQDMDTRIKAAQAVAPFCHPRMLAVQASLTMHDSAAYEQGKRDALGELIDRVAERGRDQPRLPNGRSIDRLPVNGSLAPTKA